MSLRFSPTWVRGQDAAHRARAAVRRVTPGPATIRACAFVLGVVALIVALAGPLRSSPWTYLVLVLVAVVPAARPDGPWATAVELVVVGEWLLSALLYGEARSLVALLAIAALLYAHHTTCALAAALPISARLDSGVLLGWLVRTGVVVAVSAVLALLVVVALPARGHGTGSVLLVAGFLAAVGAAVVVAYQLHRRR